MSKIDVKAKEKLVYKKCCNYACCCCDDNLRELLGAAANECRIRLGGDSESLKNDGKEGV